MRFWLIARAFPHPASDFRNAQHRFRRSAGPHEPRGSHGSRHGWIPADREIDCPESRASRRRRRHRLSVDAKAVRRTMASMDAGTWRRVMDSNLTATFLCSKYAVPRMCRRRWGRIVNLGAAGAYRAHGSARMSAFYAAKAGIVAFSKSLAREVGPGVRRSRVRDGRGHRFAFAYACLCRSFCDSLGQRGLKISLIWSFRGAFSTNFRFPRSDDVRPIDRRTQFLVDSMKIRVCRISSTDNKSFNFGCHFLTRDGTRQSLVP